MLLTPGPTPVPEFVRTAMSNLTLHHRTSEFETIFARTRLLLLEILDMSEVVMLASSGTGAMEACVTNLTHSKALIINAGKFGERFGKICIAHNIENIELKYEWNTPASIEQIIKIIKDDPKIDAICIQICESAGGLRHPVEDIAQIVKDINSNISIIADGITAVGVEKIDTTNIDALITGSQKAFMLPPGLSIIGFSNKAVKKIQKVSVGYYFNLASEIKKQKQNTTAYTAATTLIIGLGVILKKIKEDGFENLYIKTAKRAKATRDSLKAIGFNIYPITPANAMTTIYTKNSDNIRKILKEKYNINIAGGQDHLSGKIFRINHMGLVEDFEAIWVVNAIEKVIDDLGIRKFDGTANKIFMKGYFSDDI
jgi:aspartate aminotransferase-like enzyme